MTQSVLLFDGVCNLCNGLVIFFLNHERNSDLKFSPLQSKYSQNLLKDLQLPTIGGNTIVLIKNGEIFLESAAVFEAAEYLKAPFSWIRIFKILPSVFTNFIYRLVSKYRYKVFGKKLECMVPDKKWRERFVE